MVPSEVIYALKQLLPKITPGPWPEYSSGNNFKKKEDVVFACIMRNHAEEFIQCAEHFQILMRSE